MPSAITGGMLVERFFFVISEPSSTLSVRLHEVPPNTIQIKWKKSSDEHIDYFEMSVRNLSATENEKNGNTILITNIKANTNNTIDREMRKAISVCTRLSSAMLGLQETVHLALCGLRESYVYEIKLRGVNRLAIASHHSSLEDEDKYQQKVLQAGDTYSLVEGKWSEPITTHYKCFVDADNYSIGIWVTMGIAIFVLTSVCLTLAFCMGNRFHRIQKEYENQQDLIETLLHEIYWSSNLSQQKKEHKSTNR